MVNDPVFESFYNRALAVTGIDEFKQIVRNANEYVAGSISQYRWFNPICLVLLSRGSKATAASSARKTNHNGCCLFIWDGFGLIRI